MVSRIREEDCDSLSWNPCRSMADVDGPMVTESVYKRMFDSSSELINPNDVAYALDAAVQELRIVHPDPNRWAPYIHLGI
jgi:hypothetical protein